MRVFKFLFFFLTFSISFAQTNANQEKIKQLFQNYFYYDREAIHVQFNKHQYVNTEEIAFKGYVLSKNNNTPHPQTSNVQLVVYNQQKEVVLKQLLYTEKGTFNGGIHLNDNYKSGKYIFRFYTNWMNNFNEDDSFSQTIEIINHKEPFQLYTNEPIWKTAKINFYPEGANIIEGINNSIGVKITDCNNKGLELENIVILDSKLVEITHFKTNKMGNGVFHLIPDLDEIYTLKIENENVSITQKLPLIQKTGITISYNNNLPKNQLGIAIKTNTEGLKLFQNSKLNLLIHKDANCILKEINFNNNLTEQIIYIDKKHLSNGVNSIRLIDENLNELAEKLIYHYATNPIPTTLEAKVFPNDSIKLSGKTEIKQANLSVSILPEKTICATQKKSIFGTFYLNAYLDEPEENNYSYFDPKNDDRKREMELLMLNQNKSKYLWENIKSNPPKITHTFNKGITISGKIERNISTKSQHKILLLSLQNNVFEKANLEPDYTFKFENFYAQDSTLYIFQLENKESSSKYTKLNATVKSNETDFRFPIKFKLNNCPIEKKSENSFVFQNPKKDNITNLGEVKVINKYKKEVLTHKNEMSVNSKAFKIDENELGSVLDFIGRNGYRTGINYEDNSVYIKNPRGTISDNPPAIYLDDFLLYDINILYSLTLTDIDEIYIDNSGMSDSSSTNFGTIKIYQKKGVKNDYFRTKFTSIIVTNGFSKNFEFKNSQFNSQDEFYTFGTLNWTPNIQIKDTPNYEIKFVRGNQKEIQVLLEGFTDDGQLISEFCKVPVSPNE